MISYSALTNYGKVTLPSAEGWGTSMNILKDPNRGIFTRRKNKVGETSFITDDIDAAGDRASEAIRVFARGTNPSVSVMYNNIGTAGGQAAGGLSAKSSLRDQRQIGLDQHGLPKMTNVAGAHARNTSTMASLPYKIMNGGAFRPPILTQSQRLPLSRQARAPTNAFTGKGFADFSKKLRIPASSLKTREVKDALRKIRVPSTICKKRLSELRAPQDLHHKIREAMLMQGKTAETNKSDSKHFKAADVHVDMKKFVRKDCRKATNVGYTKASRFTKRNASSRTRELLRNVPSSTWAGVTMSKTFAPRETTYRLKNTLAKGGFEGKASKPLEAATVARSVECSRANIAEAAKLLPLSAATFARSACLPNSNISILA